MRNSAYIVYPTPERVEAQAATGPGAGPYFKD